jgi:hypothetical protein
MLRVSTPLMISFLLFFHSFLTALPVINTEDHPAGLVSMSEMIPDHVTTTAEIKDLKINEQKQVRLESRMTRMSKRMSSGRSKHTLGGISDPVDKWFWIWAISWGVGILLTILFAGSLAGAAIGLIWLLAFGVGSVALVLWLVKKFG